MKEIYLENKPYRLNHKKKYLGNLDFANVPGKSLPWDEMARAMIAISMKMWSNSTKCKGYHS